VAVTPVGAFTLGEVNVGLAAALGFLNPLALQIDLFLTGAFGFGPFLADLQAQFSAAISAQVTLGLQVQNPFAAVQAAITAFAQLQAALQAALAFGLPNVSLQLGAQVAAAAALAATLKLRIGGIKALIAGALGVKIPALEFMASATAALSAGPVHLVSFTGSTLGSAGGAISGLFSSGLGPDAPILASDSVSGIVMVTKDPAVFAALGAILKVA
jgi:hypothetical protein